MSVITLRLRHTGNWVSIPYDQIQESDWRDGDDHCMVNGRTVNADGPTLTEELKNARREVDHAAYDQARELVS